MKFINIPYCGKSAIDENENYLSDKVCKQIIIIRKKTQKKLNWIIFVVDVFFHIINSGIGIPQHVGLPFPQFRYNNGPIMRSLNSNSNGGLLKKVLIAEIVKKIPDATQFNIAELNVLYELSIQFHTDSINEEELINKITNLRGGYLDHIVSTLGIISPIIIAITNA